MDRKQLSHIGFRAATLVAACCLTAFSAVADITANKPEVKEIIGLDGITWQTQTAYKSVQLTLAGPDGFRLQENFQPGDTLFLDFASVAKAASPSGLFKYELTFTPVFSARDKALAEEARALGEEVSFLAQKSIGPVSGAFTLTNGNIVDGDLPENTLKDFVISDDLIVDGSACIGFDCVNGESFGFDTLRLKENNLRIRAVDTSSTASFPSRDWQIVFNETSNGGQEKFSIEDLDAGRTPFTIEGGADANSLYVDDGGRIGLGTNTPVVELHIKDGDTPTLRLEQDGSSGFTPQIWDVAGNETNFFIRDVTNGSRLPFRITPSAPSNSIFVANSGNVGLSTNTPTAALHMRRTDGTTALLVDEQSGTASARILGTFTNNGQARLLIENRNNLSAWFLQTPGEDFEINKSGSGVTEFDLRANGDLVISGDYFSTTCGAPCAPDYVFAEDYRLMPLADLARYIDENSHLPNIPSAEELTGPINISQLQMGLLEKIEELTLYTLHQEQTIQDLRSNSVDSAKVTDELGKAHVLITQLHQRLVALEARQGAESP